MVAGALGAILVGAFVVDQLGQVGLQLAQLQAASWGMEKGIFLRDHLDRCITHGFSPAAQAGQVTYVRFDLDVGWHAAILPYWEIYILNIMSMQSRISPPRR